MKDTQTQITKQALVDSFYQLLQERPYNKIKIQDITERAYTVRANFYYHFNNKADLLEYIYKEILTDLSTALETRSINLKHAPSFDMTTLEDILYPSILENIHGLINYHRLFLIKYRRTFDVYAEMRKTYINYLQDSLPDYIYKNNSAVLINHTSYFIAYGVFGLVENELNSETEFDTETIAQDIFVHTANALQVLKTAPNSSLE